MDMKRIMLFAAIVAMVALAKGEPSGDYAAEKRRIHEQMTGQRLDADGKTIWEPVQTEFRDAAKSGGVGRRSLLAAAAPLTVSNVKIAQRSNSKLVDISYDLTGGNGTLCNVSVEICDDTTCITARTFDGDGIGPSVKVGKGKRIVWDAGADWPNKFSKKINAKITAIETELSEEWHPIYIRWGSYGGRDLDICGYWENHSTDNVGWSWGSGSASGSYQSRWYGDNTESGPEQIDVRISKEELARERKQRRYKIHFNYYGERGSPCNAKVECEGLSKTSSAFKRTGTRATKSDPCLTITFNETGKPIRID